MDCFLWSDFFDEFERTTQGENFQRKETNENLTNDAVESESSKIRKAEKDDMNDFFDEFEKTTGGENFKKMQWESLNYFTRSM